MAPTMEDTPSGALQAEVALPAAAGIPDLTVVVDMGNNDGIPSFRVTSG